jgi:hypothetical protein
MALALGPVGAAGAGAAAPTRVKRVSVRELQGGPAAFRDAVVGRRRLAGFPSPGRWGGRTLSQTGETVNVEFSDAYPVDPGAQERMADFVTSLYHGSELALATFYLAPLTEIGELCGSGIEGCYFASEGLIIAPGEDLPDGTSVETIVAHEFGHHIAAHRDNAPWDALTWGAKRWASYEGICSRQQIGTAFPGEESDNYALNPGEGWAETYRLLNFQHSAGASWQRAPWIADQSFYPDARALAAAREDVLDPWNGPTTTIWASPIGPQAPNRPPRLRKRRQLQASGPFRVVRTLATPSDGVLTVALRHAPAGTTLSLGQPDGVMLVTARPGSLSYTVCGSRTLRLIVSSLTAGELTAAHRRDLYALAGTRSVAPSPSSSLSVGSSNPFRSGTSRTPTASITSTSRQRQAAARNAGCSALARSRRRTGGSR